MPARRIGLTLTAILLSLCVVVSAAAADVLRADDFGPLHGVALAPARGASPDSLVDDALDRIAAAGATAVSIARVATVSDADRPFVDFAASLGESDRLRRTVAAAHARGLHVALEARLERQDGGPRAAIAMRDETAWGRFFDDLYAWTTEAAAAAAAAGVDLFVLPSGLDGTTHRETEWRRVVAGVRARFAGAITYAARSDDEVERIAFWDEFDLIGVEWVEAVQRPGDLDPNPRPRPSVWSAIDEDSVAVAEIAAGHSPRVEAIARVAHEFARPVWFDAGYRSVDQAWRRVEVPIDRVVEPDARDQARAVAGLLRAIEMAGGNAWSGGVLWRDFDVDDPATDAETRRRWARSASVRGKRAFDVLRRAWTAPVADRGAQWVRGRGGAAATSDPRATAIALRVLRDGGTATDAAVAAAFALCVVRPDAAGLGGGGLAVVADPRAGPVRALDFAPRAPAAVHPHLFDDLETRGLADGARRGPLVAGVPGTPEGLRALWESAGDRPWSDLIRPALEMAARGFEIDATLGAALAAHRVRLNAFESTRSVFLPGGRLRQPGDRMDRPRVAETLLALSRNIPTDAGERAAAVAAAGGLWTAGDLRPTRPDWSSALRWSLRADGRSELHVPPTAGGVATLLALEIARRLRLGRTDPFGADRQRRWFEVVGPVDELVHARAGDLRHGRTRATDLLRAREVAALMRRASVTNTRAAMRPRRSVHVTVIDAAGRATGLVLDLGGAFGSAWIDPSTGVLLNDALLDFDVDADRADFDPGGPNVLRPGARPRSIFAPVVLTRSGRVVLAVTGSAHDVAQVVHALDVDGWTPDRAVAAPRLGVVGGRIVLGVRHWPGARSSVDRFAPADAVGRAPLEPVGVVVRPRDREFGAVADPRGPGAAGIVDWSSPSEPGSW